MQFRSPCCRQPTRVPPNGSLDSLTCPICSRTFAVAAEDRTISDYYLLTKVGEGAFGEVWKSRHNESNQHLAIKVAAQGDIPHEEMTHLTCEAQLSRQIDHPNVISANEVGFSDGHFFIASEFVEGMNLHQWMLKTTDVDEAQIAELCATLAEALEAAHKVGVIHRDIKPENIMIDTEGTPCLIDFGMSKCETNQQLATIERYRQVSYMLRHNGRGNGTKSGPVLGTLHYMPPELARGEAINAGPTADIYSLGVVLYELLTGQRPFEKCPPAKLATRIIRRTPKRPRKLNRRLSPELEAVCLKAMAKKPEDRFQSAAEMARECRRVSLVL